MDPWVEEGWLRSRGGAGELWVRDLFVSEALHKSYSWHTSSSYVQAARSTEKRHGCLNGSAKTNSQSHPLNHPRPLTRRYEGMSEKSVLSGQSLRMLCQPNQSDFLLLLPVARTTSAPVWMGVKCTENASDRFVEPGCCLFRTGMVIGNRCEQDRRFGTSFVVNATGRTVAAAKDYQPRTTTAMRKTRQTTKITERRNSLL